MATAFSLLLCLHAATLAAAFPEQSQNVLLIVADDDGLELTGYGNSDCATPNLDRLASESVLFHSAFTSVSSCSPSRASILTGRNSASEQARRLQGGRAIAGVPSHQSGMYGLHQSVHHYSCFDGVRSLPHLLAAKGVRTGIVGKKHVGPQAVFPFDFEATEEEFPIMQVGRNITLMHSLVSRFLDSSSSPFFLYVGFHDPHRCEDLSLGAFCELFGANGSIPDWTPAHYDPAKLTLPAFLPDTEATRRDLAAMYTAISRLDQGVALLLGELSRRSLLSSTLVLYTSDNGISFPNGRTNVYDPGVRVPLLLRHPQSPVARSSSELVSLLDLAPTLLDWFGVPSPRYSLNGHQVELLGHSLLPLLEGAAKGRAKVFGSHSLHEVTMFYPMRSVRTRRYKLIKNMNAASAFPIDQSFFFSDTFQDLLERTRRGLPIAWSKNLTSYQRRPPWELFDVEADPLELHNLADEPRLAAVRALLRKEMHHWQRSTADPFLCYPEGVLDTKADKHRCVSALASEHPEHE